MTLQPQPAGPFISATTQCRVASWYDGASGFEKEVSLTLDETVGESPDGSPRPLVLLRLMGDEVQRTADGAAIGTGPAITVVLPPRAIPALALGIERLLIQATKHQESLRGTTTSGLHALLPLLSLEAVAMVARSLVVARETGTKEAAFVLHTMLVCEMASRVPREDVAALLLDAMGAETASKAEGGA